MNTNEKAIHDFYNSFKIKDFKGMQESYADEATFSDPVFQDLNTAEVRAMWEMLLLKAKDFRIEFGNITANEHTGTAHWDAYYTFSATGRQVINRVDAEFEFKDGKIVKHKDKFDFYKWATQAFGIKGFFLGWTNFFRKKVQQQAFSNLRKFMSGK